MSARTLDMRRLGKQRVEALQIVQALAPDSGSSWRRHPAVLMWRGHEWWLLQYAIEICSEWRRRGYRDTLLPRFLDMIEAREIDAYPPWLGDERLHSSHRANLLRKFPEHYGSLGWTEDPTMGYHWPTKEMTTPTDE